MILLHGLLLMKFHAMHALLCASFVIFYFSVKSRISMVIFLYNIFRHVDLSDSKFNVII